MQQYAEDERDKQEIKKDMFSAFEKIAEWLCGNPVIPTYDIEMLTVVGADTSLESPDEICQHFVKLCNGDIEDNRFDLFCAVVPYDSPIVKVQRKAYCGKPVRLSMLLDVAVSWPHDSEYNTVVNYVCQLLQQVTGYDRPTVFRQWIKWIIAHRQATKSAHKHSAVHDGNHDPDCVCQQGHKTIILTILKFLGGEVFELKWDVVIFFSHEGNNLGIPELLALLTQYDVEDKPLELSMQGSGIPYGWSPADTSGDTPIRLSELVTHVCTLPDEDKRDDLTYHLARIINSMTDELSVSYVYQCLGACHQALNNTHLH